jgi:hypothetical protein
MEPKRYPHEPNGTRTEPKRNPNGTLQNPNATQPNATERNERKCTEPN